MATESGMASAQISVAAGVSGHNPAASNPVCSAEGFEMPRSTVHGASAVMQTGAQAFASHWLGRVQSLFGGAANVQPMPQAWAPSPRTSPPRQSRPLQPLERGGRILQDEGQVALFSGANAQQLAAMEQRAPLLYGSPDRHPHTESSSIPHDAIQAEVARQLDGLKQQLRAEQERVGRAEAELLRIRSQQAGEVEATALQQVGTREVGFSGIGDSGFGSHPVASTGVGFALFSSSAPPPPPLPSAPEPQGLAGLFSGLLGSGARSSSPARRGRKQNPEAASAAGPTDREILIAGVHQLEDLAPSAMAALHPRILKVLKQSSQALQAFHLWQSARRMKSLSCIKIG